MPMGTGHQIMKDGFPTEGARHTHTGDRTDRWCDEDDARVTPHQSKFIEPSEWQSGKSLFRRLTMWIAGKQ